jgi:phosphoglycerol transferase MdoB-like AlkP superfamily enzyme
MKNNLNKFISRIKNNSPLYIKKIKRYINSDFLFFYFFVGCVLNGLLLRAFTVKNYFDIKPIIADMMIILVISGFSYFVKKKNRFTYFMIWSCVLTAICVINSVYYHFYNSFVSVSLISTSIFVFQVGDAVVKNVMQLRDFTYILFPVLYIALYWKLNKNRYFQKTNYILNKGVMASNLFVVAFILAGIFVTSLTPIEYSRLNKQWNREFLVAKFGIYTYHVNDLIKSLEPRINTMFGYDKAAKEFRDYYAEKQNEPIVKNEYTNVFTGKNIIAIHAESIQSFAMGLTFNGQEVTPNLNKLAKGGLNFTNYYAQVSVGTSSDTEFTLNTSLLPTTNGTVFVSYWNREYVTIPKLLKEQGYYSFSMHGNNGTFWNRLLMHKEMGYDKFYHKTSFTIDETIGLGLSDKSFFRQAVPIIQELKNNNRTPFYGTLIMLTNHTPFDETEKYGDFPVDIKVKAVNDLGVEQEVSYPYMEGTTMGNYLKAVHYADAAIGQFMQDLDTAGLLENTVVVIYGDHDARLPKSDFVRLYNYDYKTNSILLPDDPNYKNVDYYQYELDRKLPFIIWTKEGKVKKQVKTVMGAYDVLPTLGNMFDFRSKYQLGHDIFSTKENIIIFPNGNWMTDKVYYNGQKDEYLMLKDQPLPANYIENYRAYADKSIAVSDSIILYDLIRKENELDSLFQEYK